MIPPVVFAVEIISANGDSMNIIGIPFEPDTTTGAFQDQWLNNTAGTGRFLGASAGGTAVGVAEIFIGGTLTFKLDGVIDFAK